MSYLAVGQFRQRIKAAFPTPGAAPPRKTRVATAAPSAERAKCTPPQVAGGFIWDESRGPGKGFWRRGRPNECGNPAPSGAKRAIHRPGGVVETSTAKDGKWVSTGVKATRERKECIDAGVPEPFLTECYNLRRQGMPMQEVIDKLQGQAPPAGNAQAACANAGVPAELVGECALLLEQGVPIEQISAAISQQAATAEAETRGFPLGLVAAGGGALLLLLLLRRK